MFYNLSVVLDIISCGFLTFALSIFIYCSMFSTQEWANYGWLFGSFLCWAILLKIPSLFFIIFGRKINENVQFKLNTRVMFVIFLTFIAATAILFIGCFYLSPLKVTISKLLTFLFISFCIILISRYSIKWPLFSSRSNTFIISGIFILLVVLYVELQTSLWNNDQYLISSVWNYINIGFVRFQYLMIIALTIITVVMLNLFYELSKKHYFVKIIKKREKILLIVFFMLTAFSFFVCLRRKVAFGEDLDFLLHSVGGVVYYKYPLAYLLPQLNFLIFSNLFCPDTPYHIFHLLAGLIIFIQIFRLWKLLWPEDLGRRFLGWVLTIIPYSTAQFFFGYSGRKTIELAFLASLIYYTVSMIKNGKGFFLVGLLTALTFCSHNVQILILPSIGIACFLASGGQKRRFRVLSGLKCFLGFLIGYLAVYGLIGYLQRIFIILFDYNNIAIKEELLWKLSLNQIFNGRNIQIRIDYINSYGAIGVLLIAAMWLRSHKKIFIGDKKNAIFLGLLAVSSMFWVPWKDIWPLWFNFDQIVAPFIILNIFGIYLWLGSAKNIKEFILPSSILIVVFGMYSITLINFMHNHRNELNFSFKNKPQSIIPDNWGLIDKLDFGNHSSERMHDFKIEGSEDDWASFFSPPAIRTHSYVIPSLLKHRDIMRILLFYGNDEAVADEGRLCRGSIEFTLKTKSNVSHFLLWRTPVFENTAVSVKKDAKNPPLEITINGEKIGIWEMCDSLKIHPARNLNNYVVGGQRFPHQFDACLYGGWHHWEDFMYKIPAKYTDRDKIKIEIVPKGGIMQIYYLWLYAETV